LKKNIEKFQKFKFLKNLDILSLKNKIFSEKAENKKKQKHYETKSKPPKFDSKIEHVLTLK